MYKYFATKEDLYITCIHRGQEILDDTVEKITNSDEKILVKAEKLIRAVCQLSKKNSSYIRLYNELTSGKGSEVVDLLANEIESNTSRMYITAIAQAFAKGDVRQDLDPRMFAFFLDNLLTSLQFSFTCDYYRERFKVYTGVDVDKADEEQIVEQLLRFIESAFAYENK